MPQPEGEGEFSIAVVDRFSSMRSKGEDDDIAQDEIAALLSTLDLMTAPTAPHRVFSYGTLRQTNVQQALYGRAVSTIPDVLPSWRLDWLDITDPDVIRASGSDRHPILRRGTDDDAVEGAYLELNDEELKATDRYEVADYVRRAVVLASGVEAFVYVADGD